MSESAPEKKQIKTVAVFCSSRILKYPIFTQHAHELGVLLGQNGFNLVYGGGSSGLMGVVSKAARDHGSRVFGVITHDFRRASSYKTIDGIDERIVKKLEARKARMIEQADLVIVLPGGFGSVDEMCHAAALLDMKISGNSKEYFPSIIMINSPIANGGYWDYFMKWVDVAIDCGAIWPGRENILRLVNTPQEAILKAQAWNQEGLLRACDIPQHAAKKTQLLLPDP